jgi:hypothetical protein
MVKPYMVNEKTGNAYEVLGMIQKDGKPYIRLKGRFVDMPFEEPYSKERMVKLGYKLERRDA